MIPDGPIWRVLIRTSIVLFRSVTPLCIVHCILYPFGLVPVFKIYEFNLRFGFITIPETLFYLLLYLPKRHALQPPAAEGDPLSHNERLKLFDRFWSSVPDMEYFLTTWFRGAPLGAIKKENIKDLLAWAFLNKFSPLDKSETKEVEGYIKATEKALGITFEEGRGLSQPVRPTFDPINIQHRPLSYYICGVGLMDTLVFLRLWRLGFQYHGLTRYFQSFPYRPLGALSRHRSPARDVSYWYRPHTSMKRLPILYIHGIGIGLITYVNFFSDLVSKDTGTPDDQVGILAIEIMPISFRITSPALHSQEMVYQINQILHHHGWDGQQFVLTANSYGTIIATHLLRSPTVSPNINSMVLVDPVTVWIHMGDVAYNFTAKAPATASEHQLHYFACTDIGAAHTVTRRFVWTENLLWKDEFRHRRTGFVVSGRDIILDGARLKNFLIDDQPKATRSSINSIPGAELIKSGEMEVLWFEHLNHAEVFERKKERMTLVEMVWKYCSEPAPTV